jgi:hypothetical protein
MCSWYNGDSMSIESKVLTFYVLDICEKVALFVKFLFLLR